MVTKVAQFISYSDLPLDEKTRELLMDFRRSQPHILICSLELSLVREHFPPIFHKDNYLSVNSFPDFPGIIKIF